MYTNYIVALAALSSYVSAHGVVTKITGANGVVMPALSIQDGVPRDCATPACGAEQDTSVFNGASPLGKTKAGNVNAATMVAMWMGTSAAAAPAASTSAKATKAGTLFGKRAGGLAGLLGGGKGAGAGGSTGTTATGTKTAAGTKEDMVAASAGKGADAGMPTCADDGTVTMTLHQVNQDGAGPFTAAVDPTSGGTSEAAFQKATVSQNVGGIGFGGLSGVTTTDFEMKVVMPAGMTCSGTVAGVQNVCIARVMNSAAAGPFGGSVAFTQGAAAKKRAVEYNRVKRSRIARGLDA